jgi:hypothetical protein
MRRLRDWKLTLTLKNSRAAWRLIFSATALALLSSAALALTPCLNDGPCEAPIDFLAGAYVSGILMAEECGRLDPPNASRYSAYADFLRTADNEDLKRVRVYPGLAEIFEEVRQNHRKLDREFVLRECAGIRQNPLLGK